jgi:Domain of unknown function (DUF4136)
MRTICLLPLLLALASCAARYDVRTDRDPAIDFSVYQTFAIPPRPKADTPDVLDNALVRKRLEGMFAKHLSARGLVLAPEADPADLLVRYWVTTEAKTDVSTVPAAGVMMGPGPYGYGYPSAYPYWGGRWGSMYQDVVVRNYTEGTLVLDLVDRAKDELVWRAYVVGTLSRERETMYELVDEALGRAFRELPREATAGASKVWSTAVEAPSASSASIAPHAD